MSIDATDLFRACSTALASVTTKAALAAAITRYRDSKDARHSQPTEATTLPLYVTDELYTDISARLVDLAGGESGNVYKFLKSASFASVLQHATAADLVRGSATVHSTVNLSYRLAVELEAPQGFDVERLFPVICDAISRSLAVLLPEPADRKRLERGATAILLSSQLESLARLVELRTSAVDSKQVLAFADRTRPATHDRFRLLTTPHWDSAPRVPIDDVYIRGRFAVPDATGHTLPPRMVLLGSPGGGKTTFARHLAFHLTDEAILGHFGDATPNNAFFVTLREFEQSGRHALLEFIEDESRTVYSIEPPRGAVELLLLGGKAVVILDGLDELLDTTKRRRMVEIVEGFARSYPNAPLFVTSRRVGYDAAPLDDTLFFSSELEGFDANEVHEYVDRWFATHPDLNESEAQRRAAQFLRTSEPVDELRRNPLLLALLCNLYKATQYLDLPRTRASIYEKCALTLYDRWDRHRNIGNVDFERDFLPPISAVASRIYGDGKLEQGISKPRLITMCVDFLYPLKFDKRADAEAFAGSTR